MSEKESKNGDGSHGEVEGGLTEDERTLVRGGATAENREAYLAALEKLIAYQTEGKPFRYQKNDTVNVRRTSGDIEGDWRIHEVNPNGMVVVTREGETGPLFKDLTWKELYAVNPETPEQS